MIEIINLCGDKFYLHDGILHNDNGPSIEYKNGVKWWFYKGKLHREDGKAIEDRKEIFNYWINGEPATEEQIKNIKRNIWIDRFNNENK